jgi:hypothetical protein
MLNRRNVSGVQMADTNISPAFEQHYKAQYLAKLWNISYETLRRRANDFPRAIRLGNPNSRKRTRGDKHSAFSRGATTCRAYQKFNLAVV